MRSQLFFLLEFPQTGIEPSPGLHRFLTGIYSWKENIMHDYGKQPCNSMCNSLGRANVMLFYNLLHQLALSHSLNAETQIQVWALDVLLCWMVWPPSAPLNALGSDGSRVREKSDISQWPIHAALKAQTELNMIWYKSLTLLDTGVRNLWFYFPYLY